jgi:hypothetical protein
LADVVQRIWPAIGCGGSETIRLVIRLSGMPSVAAALFADRMMAAFLPASPAVVDPAHLLRSVGAMACSGTGHAAECVCAGRIAYLRKQPLDEQLFLELIEELQSSGRPLWRAVAALGATRQAARREEPEPRSSVYAVADDPATDATPLESMQKAIRGSGVPSAPLVFGRAGV